MFDFSFLELLVVSVVALFVMGPENLPRAIISSQKKLRAIRYKFYQLKHTIDQEISAIEHTVDKQNVTTDHSEIQDKVS